MKPVRIGICVLLAFSVLAHGAVEYWSQAVLIAGAAALLAWWAVQGAVRARWRVRGNGLVWCVAGLCVLAAVQYAAGISAVSYLTRIELLKLAALGTLAFLAVQAFETPQHWRGFVWFLLTLGFLVSVLGVLQHFTFNGKLYWFRELRYGGVPFGPYVNRNHFAGLIEMVVPTGLAMLLLRAEDRDRMSLLGLLTLFPIGALFLSASRGGLAGFFVASVVAVLLAFARRRDRGQWVAASLILLLASGLVGWLGIGRALDRFAGYQELEVTESRRLAMIRDSWRIFLDRPIAGSGLGTLQEVYPRYETSYDGKVVNHSHNDYVEGLAEAGLIGGLLGAAFLGVLFRQGRRQWIRASSARELALRTGAAAACSGLLVHSLVDFNLHIPSNALLFLLLAVLATTNWSREEVRGGAAAG